MKRISLAFIGILFLASCYIKDYTNDTIPDMKDCYKEELLVVEWANGITFELPNYSCVNNSYIWQYESYRLNNGWRVVREYPIEFINGGRNLLVKYELGIYSLALWNARVVNPDLETFNRDLAFLY